MSKDSITDLFKDVIAVIIEQGIGKARRQILAKQLEEKGGKLAQKLDDTVTHIIVSSTTKYSRLPKILKVDHISDNVHVVYADWLSSSLVAGKKLDHTPFLLRPDTAPLISPKKQTISQKVSEFLSTMPSEQALAAPTKSPVASSSIITTPTKLEQVTSPSKIQTSSDLKLSPLTGKRKWVEPDSDSDYIESDDDEDDIDNKGGVFIDADNLTEQGLIRPLPKKGRWMCQVPSSQLQAQINHNKHITDKLEELLLTYQTSSLPKDRWRAMSLTKVIAAIRRHPKEITTYEEARGIPFVGDRLADKIHEIITSGHLRRLDEVDKTKQSVIDLFKAIHGVGQTTAEQFYAQGYRTLQDLKDANILNRQQQIGMKYYDEFLERMPRSEVEEIEQKICDGCHRIDTGLEVVTCGSYRRGKPTCGDVDILITHPDGRSHKGIFSQLIQLLKEDGFLTDDLTIHEDPVDGSCKYFGVCLLQGEGRKHRRIDIYICPYSEYPLMLLHFTGSGHFNRSIRSRADKMGMSLSEHSLNVGVIRKNGVKIFEGTPLPVFSEADVFKYLGIDYLEPHDRDLD